MMAETILITGSNGFIGKNLVEYFGADKCVLAPKREELDLLDPQSVASYISYHKPDVVIHCASSGLRKGTTSADEIIHQNITMFENMAFSLRKGQKMINLGSGAEYNRKCNLHKISEEDFGCSIPEDAYGYSKYLISQKIDDLEDVCNLRLFGVFGRYEHPDRFISYAIMQHLKKEPIIMKRNVVFDYLYIDDLFHILEKFLNQWPTHKQINVTPSESISLLEVTEIVEVIDKRAVPVLIGQEGLNAEYTGNNARLMHELGEYDFLSYHDSIKNLYLLLKMGGCCNTNSHFNFGNE